MAEGGLSAHHRIRLVQMFGNDSTAWRTAIAAACHERSWTYHEHWQGDAPAESGTDMLIVSSAETPDPAATAWVVMSSSPQEVLDAMEGFGFSSADAAHHASKVLAVGSALAQRGATVVDGRQSSINLPQLGEGRLDRSAPAAPITDRVDGLGLYRTLPPKRGVAQNLDLGLLSFPTYRDTDTGGPQISLLGQRRLLFVAPTLFLSPGRWRAVLTFTVETSTPVRLLFVWGFGTDVAKVEEVISQSGRYQMSLVHDWNDVGPADLTGGLAASRLEGELVLESCELVLE